MKLILGKEKKKNPMAPRTTMTSVLEVAVEQELIQVHVKVSFRSSD